MECLSEEIPLHDIDAEKSLIGTLIVKNSLFDDLDILPSDLYSLKHQRTLQTMQNMFFKRERVDADALFLQLKKDHPEDKTLSGQEILEILENSPLLQLKKYCKIIKECSVTRQVKLACATILSSRKIGDDILTAAQKGILDITSGNHQDDVRKVKDIIMGHMDRIEQANATRQSFYYKLGFPRIDSRLKAIGPKLIVVAGRPGAGKTSFALTCARNLNTAGICSGIISIEMPEFEIIDRILSMESGVTASKFGYYDGLNSKEYQMVSDAAAFLYESNMLIDSGGGLDIVDVERKCRRMKRDGAQVVFIDQLSQIGNKEINASDLTTRYSENVTRLSALKKELQIPIFLLAQLNRDMKARSNKKPILSDLKQSGKIEEDADAVIFVHRPEEYAPEEEAKKIRGAAIIDLAKNRSGAKFTENKVRFIHEQTLFVQEDYYG